jgi:hypothetical protein
MRITVDGHQIDDRVWAVVVESAGAAGIPTPRLLQGSWSHGDLSGDTHAGDGAGDLSVRGLTDKQQVAFVVELRRRNAVAWVRSKRYGWDSGDHIHMILRDQPGLSMAAQKQVHLYDLITNGLRDRGRDPHPRPVQHPIEEVRHMEWPVGTRKMIKSEKAVAVPGGEFVTLATIDLPKGAAFECSLQVRMPDGVAQGEAHLGRVGWGTVTGTAVDETGHNVILPATDVESWRTPVHHNIVGGGPLAFRIWLPPRADAKPHRVKFVAKAIRTH